MTPADLDALVARINALADCSYWATAGCDIPGDATQVIGRLAVQAAAAITELRDKNAATQAFADIELQTCKELRARAERAEAEVSQMQSRQRWRDEAQITHYEGCWRDHYGCAMERIKALEGERDALQKNCTALVQMFELAAAIPSMSDEQLRQLVANGRAAIDAAKEKP